MSWLRSSFVILFIIPSIIKGNENSFMGGKAKKIQIVYIKVPLSKVLQQTNSASNFVEGSLGSATSGNGQYNQGQQNNFRGNGPINVEKGVPGEGNHQNYGNSNNNDYGRGRPDGANFGQHEQQGFSSGGNEQGNLASYEGNSGPTFGNGQADNFAGDGFGNDANLGTAYGAAVSNALPQSSSNFADENYGPGINQNGNSGSEDNYAGGLRGNDAGAGYQSGPSYGSAPGDNFGGFAKTKKAAKKTIIPIVVQVEHGLGKMNKKNKMQYPKNYGKIMQQDGFGGGLQTFSSMAVPVPIPASSMPANSLPFPFPIPKPFSSSFGGSGTFPSFGNGKGLSGSSFGGFGGMSTLGGLGGLGGIRNKLTMLLGNRFGMGAGGLLSMMTGWD